MKIIHIVHGKANPASENGISRVVYYLNKHEKLQGIDSQIWAIVDNTKKHFTYKRDEFVTVECYPRVRTKFWGTDIIKDIIKEKDNIDLVHFHLIWFYDKNIIAVELKKWGIPFIITTHGTYSNPQAYTGKRFFAKYLYETKYLNMATECHILTREEGTGLAKYGYKGKCFVAYNGYDKSEIPISLNKDYFKDKHYANKLILLWVGVLRRDKNITSIIEAISLLPKNIREKIMFVAVGPDYKHNANKLKRLAEKLNVIDAFDWIGPLYKENKYSAIVSADGYIMPSFSEGFSMSIIDAMICRKPMILTSGCNLNYLQDEPFFIKCEPYAQDLAKAIEEFCTISESERRELGEKAQMVAKKKISWDKIVTEMIKNYERIISYEK